MAIQIGKSAPTFRLPSTAGREVGLADLRGRKVVLYFYPKDDTPGCTVEACDFRDNLARVRNAGAEVFGVSKDSLDSHAKFRRKYEIPFELLSDAESRVAKAYGAYGQKMMYGKPVVGTIRSTVLIDEQGNVEAVWSPVKVAGHVEQVLSRLRGESAPLPSSKKRSAAAAPAPKSAAPKRRRSTPRTTKKR